MTTANIESQLNTAITDASALFSTYNDSLVSYAQSRFGSELIAPTETNNAAYHFPTPLTSYDYDGTEVVTPDTTDFETEQAAYASLLEDQTTELGRVEPFRGVFSKPDNPEINTVTTDYTWKEDFGGLGSVGATVGVPVYTLPAELDWESIYEGVTPEVRRVWESAAMDSFYALLEKWLSGEEAWLSATYQQNSFDQDKDRRLQVLDDTLRLTASRYAARKFRVPASLLSAQENESILKYQYDATTASRSLASEVIKAAKEYQQFALGKGLEAEQVNVGFTEAYNKLFLDRAKTLVDSYVAQLTASSTAFKLRLEAVMAGYDLQIKQADVNAKYAELKTTIEKINLEVFKTTAEVGMAANSNEAKVYDSLVQAEKARLDGELLSAKAPIEIANAVITATGDARKTSIDSIQAQIAVFQAALAKLESERKMYIFDVETEFKKVEIDTEVFTTKVKADFEGLKAGVDAAARTVNSGAAISLTTYKG